MWDEGGGGEGRLANTVCFNSIDNTIVSRKYAPPFATLALVQDTGGEEILSQTGWGGGIVTSCVYTGCDNFSRDYALPSGHEVIIGGGWTKHGASPSARQRDAHGASGRLTSFSVEEQVSRVLPRSSWHVHC